MIARTIALAAVFAVGSSSSAQNFRLDLFLVARENTGTADAPILSDIGGTQASREAVRPQTPTGNVVNAVVGQSYRVELRYRIADLIRDTTGSRGLSSANIAFATSFSGPAPTAMQRAALTEHQAGATTILDPDTSGYIIDPAGPLTGLIGEFRGGLVTDADSWNGMPNAAQPWTITPLALSSPGHNSWRTSQNPTEAPSANNTDINGQLWSIYAFDFVYNGGQVQFVASALANPQTTNRFGYFARAFHNAGIPQTSNLAHDGLITFIPAPAAAPLLAVAALGMRRRRSLNVAPLPRANEPTCSFAWPSRPPVQKSPPPPAPVGQSVD